MHRGALLAWWLAGTLAGSLAPASDVQAQASDCAVATDQAMGADLKAATARSNRTEQKELLRLFDLAVAWWQQAVEVCDGRSKDRAQRNLGDSQQARDAVADQQGNTVACTSSYQDAAALQQLAEQAATDRRWQEAALLYRKVESTWDLAAERCNGGPQRVAVQRREQAVTDARNALANANSRERPVATVTVPANDAATARPTSAGAGTAPAPVSGAGAFTPTELPAARPNTAVNAPVAGAAGALSAVARLVDVQMTGGARLVGTFNADVGGTYSGRGKIIWANGEVYDGAVLRSLRHGVGEFTWLSGQRYTGDWVQDKPEGNGVLRFANGNQYEGPVVAGEPQGSGKMIYASGDSYSGQFNRGEPDGQGLYTWLSGQRYDGSWVRGKASGKGALNFANGNAYEGDIAEGLPHGQGRLAFISGDSYRGQFVQGVPDGQGTYNWKNGDQYNGGWKGGQKQGQGTMQWRNGDRWEGVFQADAQTAQGTLIRKTP